MHGQLAIVGLHLFLHGAQKLLQHHPVLIYQIQVLSYPNTLALFQKHFCDVIAIGAEDINHHLLCRILPCHIQLKQMHVVWLLLVLMQ
jgi:hypothetical protein